MPTPRLYTSIVARCPLRNEFRLFDFTIFIMSLLLFLVFLEQDEILEACKTFLRRKEPDIEFSHVKLKHFHTCLFACISIFAFISVSIKSPMSNFIMNDKGIL